MKEQYESIVKMCQELLDKGPVATDLGICHSLAVRNDKVYLENTRLIKSIINTWPKFSGSWVYPIPCDGTDYTCAHDCFNGTVDLWKGKQGELRRELLHYIIQYCKREILNLSFPRCDIGPFRALLVE